jgi:hypothetical protein
MATSMEVGSGVGATQGRASSPPCGGIPRRQPACTRRHVDGIATPAIPSACTPARLDCSAPMLCQATILQGSTLRAVGLLACGSRGRGRLTSRCQGWRVMSTTCRSAGHRDGLGEGEAKAWAGEGRPRGVRASAVDMGRASRSPRHRDPVRPEARAHPCWGTAPLCAGDEVSPASGTSGGAGGWRSCAKWLCLSSPSPSHARARAVR